MVVDRLVAKSGMRPRLTDSVETALGLADGRIDIDLVDEGTTRTFSEHMSCPNEHPLTIDEIEPRSFSFNSPFGACPTCDGIGTRLQVDEDLVVPDEDLSLGSGAIAPWSGGKQVSKYFNRLLKGLGDELGFDMKTPWKKLPKTAKTAILTGKDYKVHVKYKNRFGRERTYSTGFEGVYQYIQRKHEETESEWSRERYESYMREIPCASCQGTRLKPEILAVKVGDKSIAEVSELALDEAADFLGSLELSTRDAAVAAQVMKERPTRIPPRRRPDYLSLNRAAGTLSGGEAQRIRLATQIGSGLVGVLYVLDEPSIGLHQRDNRRLIETLNKLKDLGNTLIVVEHDEDTIESAGWIVDTAPEPASTGRSSVDPVPGLKEAAGSVTGDYLVGVPSDSTSPRRRQDRLVTVEKAVNNSRCQVSFPLGVLTASQRLGFGQIILVSEILPQMANPQWRLTGPGR